MIRISVIGFFCCMSSLLSSQNDEDAIRFSRIGVGGTARFTGMGGAFGAVGADLSNGAYNPAGLGVYRRNDLSFSGGLKTSNNSANIYKTNTRLQDARFVFNNFGIAGVWKATRDPDNRHILAFSNTQVQNFSSATRMSGYTNNSSIAKDMLNLAQGTTIANLNPGYEYLGYDTYVIDFDSAAGKYFSFVDTKRSVKQTRDLVTTGRVNDINLSYAFTYKDKYYLGASVGFPQVDYTSLMTHTETDDRDSMRVVLNPDQSFTTTYVDDLPFVYSDKLGFHSLTYDEYFKTSGSAFNVKIGGIVRVSDQFRIGGYYHSPTIYRLTDSYQNSISVAYDKAKSDPIELTDPENEGTFTYRITTPARIALNTAFLIEKKGVIALDYEMVNYKKSHLSSANISDFANANDLITKKYKAGHNIKLGGELNLSSFMVRAGYAINGSPFGGLFGSEFSRTTMSFGAGYRSKGSFYVDVVWSKTISTEPYYLFTDLDTKAQINYNSGTVGVTVGLKF